MTELDSIELTHEVVLETEGHDIFDLMYRFLDEFLYLFATEYFVGRRMICKINEEELYFVGRRMICKINEEELVEENKDPPREVRNRSTKKMRI